MSDVRVSKIISANYHPVHRAVREHDYTHFMLDGGRGSLKSSFISLEIPLLMKRNPDVNAIVFRKVANTLRTSVYEQMLGTNAAYYMKQLADAVLREQNPSMGTEITRNILKKARSDMLAASAGKHLFGLLDRVYLYELGQRRVDELKRLGYRKVRFVAVLDNATTDVCRNLNGMKFDVDKLVVGKNAPPIYPPPHPCRSRLVGIK